MEEKLHQLISSRSPWLLKDNPFSNLIYLMPPYIISQKDLKFLLNQLENVINLEY